MRPAKSFTIRIILYSVGLIYLAGDLFLFNGPINRRIQAARPDSNESLTGYRKLGIVARVMGQSIYLSQVERAVRERLWLKGKSLDDLTPDQRRTERLAALNDLIDHEMLRMKVKHNTDKHPVSEEEIDAAVLQLAARFASREDMETALKAESIDSERELRLRLGALIQQEKYVERIIAEGIRVADDEASEWFAENAEKFALPRRFKVRHVFLATLDRDPAKAKATLQTAATQLRSGAKDFATLAKELSDDARTKQQGGDLGWMTENRLPADLASAIAGATLKQPTLIQSDIGWHLLEVTDRKAPEPRTFEEAKDEVYAALESSKRIEMVERTRKAIRATDGIGVHIFLDMISSE